ncbi:MAG TPA: B-box zinc finger protein [Polyangiaceae bacterium]|nr:B-box zinc finger protein [Polyangiaceae bacterium]
MEALPCSEHPGRPAPKRCASCARWLCVECWRFNVDGLPWCAPCVALIRDKKDRLPVSFALTALLLEAGFAVAVVRRGILNRYWAGALVAFAGLFVVGTVRSMRGERSLLSRQIAEVKDGTPGIATRKLGNLARRTIESALPSWSSKTTVLVLLAGFGLAALLVPAGLKLSRIVETEVVLVAWLAMLWICLSVTLYRGARLGDDHVLRIRAPNFMGPKPWSPEIEVAVRAGGDALGCMAADGCVVVLAVLAFAMFVLGASWLLVELIFPAIFIVAYTLLRGALTRVTNDAHECAGSVPRALIWGFLWSAIYTAPLAVFVALLHWAGHP